MAQLLVGAIKDLGGIGGFIMASVFFIFLLKKFHCRFLQQGIK